MILRFVSIGLVLIVGGASSVWAAEPRHQVGGTTDAQSQRVTPLSRPPFVREALEQPNPIIRQTPPNSEALQRPDGPADILILPPLIKPAGQEVLLTSRRDEKRVTVQCRYIYTGNTPVDGISLAMSVHPAGGGTSIGVNANSISDVEPSYDPATGRGNVIPLDLELILSDQTVPQGRGPIILAVTCSTAWIDPRTHGFRDGHNLTEDIVTVRRSYLAN